MKKIDRIFLMLLLGVVFSSCIGKNAKNKNTQVAVSVVDAIHVVDTVKTKYAKGYKMMKFGKSTLVEISDPSSESKNVYKYVFVPNGAVSDSLPADYEIIRTPVKRAICMTTLQLSGFIKLGMLDRIVGITSTKFVQDSTVKARLSSGEIKKIGIEGEFDTEVVIASDPDVIFISPFKRGGYGTITDLDIATFSYLGYKEPLPLGQAEWIKLVGLMLGAENEANEIFAGIEKRYLELQEKISTVKSRPTILSGELHSGNWYVVGGKSYLAQLFSDAGSDYFMENNKTSGGFYVDYETVYSQGYNADYWRIVNSYKGCFDYKALLDSDSRYSDFNAFKQKSVIYCNLRENPFYEKTPMEPDVVLADLIKIFHPDLLPKHNGVYYTLLR